MHTKPVTAILDIYFSPNISLDVHFKNEFYLATFNKNNYTKYINKFIAQICSWELHNDGAQWEGTTFYIINTISFHTKTNTTRRFTVALP